MDRPLKIMFIGTHTRKLTDSVRSIFMGLTELGHNVQEINVAHRPGILSDKPRLPGGHGPNIMRLDAIRNDLWTFQPQLIVLCAGGLAFTHNDMLELQRNCPVIGITLSDPDVFPTVSTYCHQFTYHTTNSVESLKQYRKLGLENTLLMPLAADSRFFVPRPVDPRYACDVAIIGHGYKNRLPIARAIADRFNVRFHGRSWPSHTTGPLDGDDVLAAIYSARFLVDFPRTRAGRMHVNAGVFEAIAAGRLLFTQYFDEMERYFTYGKEIVGYHDEEDLVHQIGYYLDHPDDTNRIARAGQLQCAAEHTWAVRLTDLLNSIDIPSPTATGWNAPVPPVPSVPIIPVPSEPDPPPMMLEQQAEPVEMPVAPVIENAPTKNKRDKKKKRAKQRDRAKRRAELEKRKLKQERRRLAEIRWKAKKRRS